MTRTKRTALALLTVFISSQATSLIWAQDAAPGRRRRPRQAPLSPARGARTAHLLPVALYPDSLLAQVFMASTYPIEIVQAVALAQGPTTPSRRMSWPLGSKKNNPGTPASNRW